MPALTKPLPRPATLTSDVKQLLTEWLLGWFDGTTKALGGNGDIPFASLPLARIRWDVDDDDAPTGDPDDGTAGVCLRLALIPLREEEGALGGPVGGDDGRLRADIFVVQAWVRAGGGDRPARNQLATTVADQLKAIVNNPASRGELAARRVILWRARGPATVAEESPLALRLLTFTVRVTYEDKAGTIGE